MTCFLDGPAEGVKLCLARAPLFLRAVVNDGAWDALDRVDDRPAPGETVWVYRLEGQAGSIHTDGVDRRGRRFGRWEAIAEYRLYSPQPDQSLLRDNARWQAWARARAGAERRP
jgi:hypothetical protein